MILYALPEELFCKDNTMTSAIRRYLKNITVTKRWPLRGEVCRTGAAAAVVIPALAESTYLFDTLLAISASLPYSLRKVQIIVVVNNHHDSPPEVIADNRNTLHTLEYFHRERILAPLHLGWVDASSAGFELPENEGVGLARKIGSDIALMILEEQGSINAPIIHLDADSPPSAGYLDVLLSFYNERPRWAALSGYQHPTDCEHKRQCSSIISYEIYMRYHELALRYSGSPYAYPALGSIMSSTALAYAAAGGMNRRCAGEDFYFLQQLRKTGNIEHIPYSMVYPSNRFSQRTPFGTGRVIANENMNETNVYDFLFHPECYTVLKQWLELANDTIMLPPAELVNAAGTVHKELKSFLKTKRFQAQWEKISANHPTTKARSQQFHVWFDGLRTIQLIHHLRDTAFPNIPAEDAISTLFTWYKQTQTRTEPIMLLRKLRRMCLRTCA